MWSADDLHEGDYIICKDEDDRTKMFIALRNKDIRTISASKLIGNKYRHTLKVVGLRNHNGYKSEEFDGYY